MQTTAKKFGYKEIDNEGGDTLDVIASANNFNKWMYETIKPYCHGKILEVGSGTGNISQFFLQDGSEIMLTDIRENYCSVLKEKFSGNIHLLGVHQVDLVLPDFDEKYKNLLGAFDTVFALNVVEHIEDDVLAIVNAKKFLKENGTLIILVPAYQWLYNRFDEELYHFRRHTKTTLTKLFEATKFRIVKKSYFNALGMAGWFLSGKLLRKKTIPKNQMSFYNKIVPLAKFIDAILFKQIGLSVIVAATK